MLKGFALHREGTFEAYYKAAIHERLEAKLDLQHVQRPGGVVDGPSYVVLSIKTTLPPLGGKRVKVDEKNASPAAVT